MRTILLLSSVPFVFRLALYLMRLIRVSRFLAFRSLPPSNVDTTDVRPRTKILLLIPVLREQSVITRTIEHFCDMALNCADLRVMIVGTCRETRSRGTTTLDIVRQWLDSFSDRIPGNMCVDYCEANDEGGDRASQLNWAVARASDVGWTDWDVVGVYDADSLPSRDSIVEAAKAFAFVPGLAACQQPARFVLAANEMAHKADNPLLVANALYQDTWTIISELPMWIDYSNSVRSGHKSFRHLYFIGHGEFLSRTAYEKFRFPEGEVTDGIQLGYRMGLSGALAVPLAVFCEDDVPHDIRSLIKQHKRWFGGCMNLFSAYKSTGKHGEIVQLIQIIDGLWSQARWAWASFSFLLLCGLSLCFDWVTFMVHCVLLVAYCYILPLLSHKVMRADISVRFVDWLCIPLAVLIKAIGPNLYFCEKFFMKTVRYEKVER